METAQLEAPGGWGPDLACSCSTQGCFKHTRKNAWESQGQRASGKHLGQDPVHQEKLIWILRFLALVASWLWFQLQHLELFHCLCPAALVSPATGQELECPAEDKPHPGSMEKTGWSWRRGLGQDAQGLVLEWERKELSSGATDEAVSRLTTMQSCP